MTSTVFFDSIAPVVEIRSVELTNGVLRLSGMVSEYVYDFTISGEEIMLGEFNVSGESISFGHYFQDTNVDSFTINAVGCFG